MQENSAKSRKLTTREVADSRLLMIMIAACGGTNNRTVERVIQTVSAELRSKSMDTPVYDVRVSINGIELDFRDFAVEVQRQLDDMVMREAGELLKQAVEDKLGDLITDAHDALQRLNEGIQKKATEMLTSELRRGSSASVLDETLVSLQAKPDGILPTDASEFSQAFVDAFLED